MSTIHELAHKIRSAYHESCAGSADIGERMNLTDEAWGDAHAAMRAAYADDNHESWLTSHNAITTAALMQSRMAESARDADEGALVDRYTARSYMLAHLAAACESMRRAAQLRSGTAWTCAMQDDAERGADQQRRTGDDAIYAIARG